MNIKKIKETYFLDIEDPSTSDRVPLRGTGSQMPAAERSNIDIGPHIGLPTDCSDLDVSDSCTSKPTTRSIEELRASTSDTLADTRTEVESGVLGEAAAGFIDPCTAERPTKESSTEGNGRADGVDLGEADPPLGGERTSEVESGDLGQAASDRGAASSEGGERGEAIPEVKKERINIENECKKMKNIKTLVLEGCGTSGFYILGYIQKAIDIYKLNLNSIKNYIASSSGTITSFLLSIGYTPMEILIYVVKDSGINSSFEKIKKINIANMLLGKGIISFEIIKKIITDMTLEKIGYIPTFSDIKKKKNINLVFSVYNITKQMTEYMSYKKYPELSCIDCIEMSCAIPVIFPEIVYNRQRYIDGAVGNCFPVEMLSILKGQESTPETDREAAATSGGDREAASDYAGSEALLRKEDITRGPTITLCDRFAAACDPVPRRGNRSEGGDVGGDSVYLDFAEAGRRAVEEARSSAKQRAPGVRSTRSDRFAAAASGSDVVDAAPFRGDSVKQAPVLQSERGVVGEGGKEGDFKKNTLAISLINRHIKEEICYIYENPLKYLLSLFLIYVNEIKKNKKINKDNNIIFVDLDVSNSSITNTVLESNIQILDMFSYGYKQCRK